VGSIQKTLWSILLTRIFSGLPFDDDYHCFFFVFLLLAFGKAERIGAFGLC